MIVGEIAESVDLLVVGGGPGGYVAAIHAAQIGRSVTLVDRMEWGGLGGTCLQVGCIPSKTLIGLGESAAAMGEGATPGLSATGVEVDLAAFQRHKEKVVGGLSRGVMSLMKHHEVEVVEGTVRFSAPQRAAVMTEHASRHFEFADVVIATGSRPVALDEVLPFDGERVLDSAGMLALEALPASVCIVGGGYIGLELGTAFAKLGSRVTIVEAMDRLLPGLDADISRLVARSLKQLHVEVLLGCVVTGADDGVLVAQDAAGDEHRVEAERIGVAVGRRPNTDGLGLETLGLTTDPSGLIPVDIARLAQPNTAAIGDITAGPALAHKATAEAVVAVDALSGRHAAFAPQAIPLVMFTDPEVATTGLNADDAARDGLDVVAETFPVAALGRAATLGRRDGFVRLVAERGEGTVLGAQIVGPHASELISEATLAIEMGASLEDLALTIHAHPTLAEGLTESAELSLGRPVHVPGPRTRADR